jgi:hypothetical protein
MADVLTELLEAIAARVESVDGIRKGYYPAPNSFQDNKLPAAVVFSGSPTGESTISRDIGGMNVWTPSVLVQLYGKPRKGNTPQEFGALDRLIVPVIDAFDTAPLTVTVDGRKQHIDRCHVTGFRGSVNLNYAGVDHYGAEIYLSIKFRRPAGG